eukprot:6482913-Pyramimonas_sp.AAC.1
MRVLLRAPVAGDLSSCSARKSRMHLDVTDKNSLPKISQPSMKTFAVTEDPDEDDASGSGDIFEVEFPQEEAP